MMGQIYGSGRAVITDGFVVIVICATTLAAPSWRDYNNKPDDWYRSTEGKTVADNILSWQSAYGSWPKNIDTTAKLFSGDTNELKGTFDNGATTGEMRFLARAFNATKDARYEQVFLKGLDDILAAQYPGGGWPQFYPPPKSYHRYITFNDDAMVHLMELLREVAESADYEFVDVQRRKGAGVAFDRGGQCILKCQIRVDGKLTVWCAQHDEIDYSPRPGRSYELVSLSSAESAEILRLLMSINNPSPQIVEAVKAGAEWFESAKITGIRQVTLNGDKVITQDPNAPPTWARFYEIGSNRPIFAGRDGVKKYDVSEIEQERRNGYAWYGYRGQRVADDYARWKTNAGGAGLHPIVGQ
jgi:PelA/Pel-15E family pectate lyase